MAKRQAFIDSDDDNHEAPEDADIDEPSEQAFQELPSCPDLTTLTNPFQSYQFGTFNSVFEEEPKPVHLGTLQNSVESDILVAYQDSEYFDQGILEEFFVMR
jgi:hypothetical protein